VFICNDCDKIYIGQTGCEFKTRFAEHIPKSTSTQRSKFAEHLVIEKHSINNIDTNMEMLHKYKKISSFDNIGGNGDL